MVIIHGTVRAVTGRRRIQPAEVIKIRMRRMNIYSYKITRDYGFAPNPFFGVCTLATCKPRIRHHAKVGDWVLAFGGKCTIVPGKLVCLMRVDETMNFDEYWNDERFQCKKPKFNCSIKYCYGDNIYHHTDDATWIQENSHHSKADGINEINLTHDTQTDRVLISKLYWYFGSDAIDLPAKYNELSSHTRDYHLLKSENLSFKWEGFLKWIKTKSPIGRHGSPFSWENGGGFVRYKGEK